MIKKLLHSIDIKNIFALSIGVLISQVISFISQPIATRIFSVESFGLLAILMSIISMFSPLLTLQYDAIIVLGDSEDESNTATTTSFILVIFTSSILFVGILFYYFFYESSLNQLQMWIFIVFPLLLLSGINGIVVNYNNRHKEYFLYSKITVARSLFGNGFKILAGYFFPHFSIMVIATFISISFLTSFQAKSIIKNRKKIFRFDFKKIKNFLYKYKKQPSFSLPGLFAISISTSIIPLMIVKLYDISFAGYYSMSIAMLGIPITLLSNSVARTYLRKAIEEKEIQNSINKTLYNTLLFMFTISFLPFLILYFISPWLFSLVFGESWIISGFMVQKLIPWFFLNFIANSIMGSYIILKKQNIKFVLQMFFLLVALVSYIITLNFELTVYNFLSIVSIGYSIVYAILILVIILISREERSD